MDDCIISIREATGQVNNSVEGYPDIITIYGSISGCKKIEIKVFFLTKEVYRSEGTIEGKSWSISFPNDFQETSEKIPCGGELQVTALCPSVEKCVANESLLVNCQVSQKLKTFESKEPQFQISNHCLAKFPLVTERSANNAKQGMLAQFSQLLNSYGYDFNCIAQHFSQLDIEHFANALKLIRIVILDDSSSLGFTKEKLDFYIELLKQVDPELICEWKHVVAELQKFTSLTEETLSLVEKLAVEETLEKLTMLKLGVSEFTFERREKNVTARLKNTLRLAENLKYLVACDPNIRVIGNVIAKYGSLEKYYENDLAPRKSIQQLVEVGFDSNYLVFEECEVLRVGSNSSSWNRTWNKKLIDITTDVIGKVDEKPNIELSNVNRLKIFHEIRELYKEVKANSDRESGIRLIDFLLIPLEESQVFFIKKGDRKLEESIADVIYSLYSLRNYLDLSSKNSKVKVLKSIRTTKKYPELLFDNKRLECCLFKPQGMFHTEISRLLLNPANPFLEFWLEPYSEFVGLATLYPGFNQYKETTILMDTVDYDDRLIQFRGEVATMQFILRSLVLDANTAKAKKLAVVAAPYGKPLVFARYVGKLESSFSSIKYFPEYYFCSSDVNDSALSVSVCGTHHYTVAFGSDAELKGIIDYGYNMIEPGVVGKHYDGDKGVLEIDVAEFIAENKLKVKARKPSKLKSNFQQVVHQRPEYHFPKISKREKRILDSYDDELQSLGLNLKTKIYEPVEEPMFSALMELEQEVYPSDLRYSKTEFKKRSQCLDFLVLTIREASNIIGFVLGYCSPNLGIKDFYIDDLLVLPRYQRKNLGSILVNAISKIALVRGYSNLYVLARQSLETPYLHSFYTRLGFELIQKSDKDLLLHKPNSLFEPGSPHLTELKDLAENKLRKKLARPNLIFYSKIDVDVMLIIQELEREFPENLRYSEYELLQRASYSDFVCVVAKEQGEAIGFIMCYHDPALPEHCYFLDSMTVLPKFQKRQVGSTLMRTALAVPLIGKYTNCVFYCKQTNSSGVNLVEYYKRFGASVINTYEDKVEMQIELKT